MAVKKKKAPGKNNNSALAFTKKCSPVKVNVLKKRCYAPLALTRYTTSVPGAGLIEHHPHIEHKHNDNNGGFWSIVCECFFVSVYLTEMWFPCLLMGGIFVHITVVQCCSDITRYTRVDCAVTVAIILMCFTEPMKLGLGA